VWRKDSVFTLRQKKWLWFWIGIAVVALLLSFGKYAPFYRGLYALPYFSTIRNPAKFTHMLTFALIVLFAYGVDGLWRKYTQPIENPALRARNGSRSGPVKLSAFEKWWVRGSLLTCALGVVGWIVYGTCRQSLEQYLQTVQFDETAARQIASFSVGQPGWFLLFLALGVGFMWWVFKGGFVGKKAGWSIGLLGLLLGWAQHMRSVPESSVLWLCAGGVCVVLGAIIAAAGRAKKARE